MINSVVGETIGNARKHRDVVLQIKREEAIYCQNQIAI